MEVQDDWSPEAKFGWAYCSHSTHCNHIKLSEIDIGKLTEKAQLSTSHSNKVLATKWHQLLTHDYYSIREKLL